MTNIKDVVNSPLTTAIIFLLSSFIFFQAGILEPISVFIIFVLSAGVSALMTIHFLSISGETKWLEDKNIEEILEWRPIPEWAWRLQFVVWSISIIMVAGRKHFITAGILLVLMVLCIVIDRTTFKHQKKLRDWKWEVKS